MEHFFLHAASFDIVVGTYGCMQHLLTLWLEPMGESERPYHGRVFRLSNFTYSKPMKNVLGSNRKPMMRSSTGSLRVRILWHHAPEVSTESQIGFL